MQLNELIYNTINTYTTGLVFNSYINIIYRPKYAATARPKIILNDGFFNLSTKYEMVSNINVFNRKNIWRPPSLSELTPY